MEMKQVSEAPIEGESQKPMQVEIVESDKQRIAKEKAWEGTYGIILLIFSFSALLFGLSSLFEGGPDYFFPGLLVTLFGLYCGKKAFKRFKKAA